MLKPTWLLALGVSVVAGSVLLAYRSFDSGRSQDPLADISSRLANSDVAGAEPEALAGALNSLVQVLDSEIAERRILAEQLEELRARLAALEESLGPLVVTSSPAEQNEPVPETASQPPDARRLIADRLAAAGFTAEQINSVQRLQGEMQMRSIELDDRARREGWFNTPRYFEEFEQLDNAANPIRNELGDDAYDRYLYATGRPNRIRIASVIKTSPGEQAGLRAGDVILSYGGERLFSTGQLVSLRSEGERGAPVSVNILRDGMPMQISIPRGPIGIQTQSEMRDPAATAVR